MVTKKKSKPAAKKKSTPKKTTATRGPSQAAYDALVKENADLNIQLANAKVECTRLQSALDARPAPNADLVQAGERLGMNMTKTVADEGAAGEIRATVAPAVDMFASAPPTPDPVPTEDDQPPADSGSEDSDAAGDDAPPADGDEGDYKPGMDGDGETDNQAQPQ